MTNTARQPAPLTGKYAALREALRAALTVGRVAEDANREDGGTCNFDSPAIRLPRWNRAQVEQAANEAGTSAFCWHCYGTPLWVFAPNSRAQANARSRNAEAMVKELKRLGYNCMMYCQAD